MKKLKSDRNRFDAYQYHRHFSGLGEERILIETGVYDKVLVKDKVIGRFKEQ